MEGKTAPKGRNIQTMGTAHRIEDGTAHQLTSQNLWDSICIIGFVTDTTLVKGMV